MERHLSVFAETVTLNLGGWDPSPLILSVLVTTVSLTLRGGQFYDTVSFAMQNLFQNIGSAVIIADISKNFLSGNKSSERVFPELKNWRLGHRLSDLGVDLFADSNNSDFERNGRQPALGDWSARYPRPESERLKTIAAYPKESA